MHDSILFTALWNLLCTAFCAEGDYRSADSVLYNSVLHDIINDESRGYEPALISFEEDNAG